MRNDDEFGPKENTFTIILFLVIILLIVCFINERGKVMSEKELIAFLSANLTIEIYHSVSFGPEDNIDVRLMLFGEVISESSLTLPETN